MSGRTPSQTVGPYFTIGMARARQRDVVPGGALRIVGQVLDGEGPVHDALVELWQQGADGTLWGRCGTDGDGRFEFVTERPPDGVVDVQVFARGLLRHLVTRLYFTGVSDEVLEAVDPERRETLVAREEDGALRFDIHLQGDRETVFFAV
jgi:protocatechuate 3,4-dioxygenase, alpha subunit